MTQKGAGFGRHFLRRFLLPAGIFLALWLTADWLLTVIIRQPFPLANTPFYRPLMNVLARGRILSLLGGGLIIYPVLFFRGATLRERLLGVVLLPLAYLVTAIIHATAYFPLGEAIYYGFNSITIASFFLQFATVAVADIFCRWWVQRRDGRSQPVVRRAHLGGLLVGLLVGYLMLVWNGGETGFYFYLKGYQLLFP